ncbi:hypothetical protein NLI96_g7767 [Meripilus lineatus]|uniref:Uncharacterized protein n=1 Tax=Meripilus lineatus TaxID=2056292 RepID=A0AAD5YEL5_9APHY|nr:hypothetical protein NLI96_g7767 [Physisporinus lineatus]
MKSTKDTLEEKLGSIEEAGATRTRSKTKEMLNLALDRVGQGKPGVEKSLISLPPYPRLLRIWDYAQEVRKTLLAGIGIAVKLGEEEARVTTSGGVDKIANIGDEYLPEGVERSRRVFMPEAMFNSLADKKGRRQSKRYSGTGGAIVAGGAVDEDPNLTALSVVSVGLGALTMVGGKTLGVRGLIEGMVRVTDLFGNETVRKWAAPVLGAVTIGTAVYLVWELPSTIPKTVGRRIQAQLVKRDETLVGANGVVLQVVDDESTFLMDERGKEVKGAEDVERKAKRAVEKFREIERRAGEVREVAELVNSA